VKNGTGQVSQSDVNDFLPFLVATEKKHAAVASYDQQYKSKTNYNVVADNT